MKEYLIMAAIAIVSILVGIFIEMIRVKQHRDGTIIVETTEDGQRERIRMILDLDLDDIKKKNRLIFTIDDETSKK